MSKMSQGRINRIRERNRIRGIEKHRAQIIAQHLAKQLHIIEYFIPGEGHFITINENAWIAVTFTDDRIIHACGELGTFGAKYDTTDPKLHPTKLFQIGK